MSKTVYMLTPSESLHALWLCRHAVKLLNERLGGPALSHEDLKEAVADLYEFENNLIGASLDSRVDDLAEYDWERAKPCRKAWGSIPKGVLCLEVDEEERI